MSSWSESCTRGGESRRKRQLYEADVPKAGPLAMTALDGQHRCLRRDPDSVADRSPEALYALLNELDSLHFDAPEIASLRALVQELEEFVGRSNEILRQRKESEPNLKDCESVLTLGSSLNVDAPQIKELSDYVERRKWVQEVSESRDAYLYYHEWKVCWNAPKAAVSRTMSCARSSSNDARLELAGLGVPAKLSRAMRRSRSECWKSCQRRRPKSRSCSRSHRMSAML